MNLNATTTVVVPPSPCEVPDAIVCGLLDSVNVPAVQLAFPRVPGVALVHWYCTALAGTSGQPVKEAELAFMGVRSQSFVRAFLCNKWGVRFAQQLAQKQYGGM